jgi:hypothetical protein
MYPIRFEFDQIQDLQYRLIKHLALCVHMLGYEIYGDFVIIKMLICFEC